MRDIDPHWSTGSEDFSASISSNARAKEKEIPLRSLIPASRRPAAITGILIVFAAGFFVTQGLSGLLGQTNTNTPLSPNSAVNSSASSESAVIITITPAGIEPHSINVKAGDTVTWMNNQEMPHILTSETLLDAEGKPLNSPALFSGMSYAFTLGSSLPDGKYSYISQTSPNVSGELIIGAGTASAPIAASSLSKSVSQQVSPPTLPATVSSSSAAAASDTVIDRNPYTVGSSTNRVSSETSVSVPKPITQPQTGSGGMWGLVGGSVAVLCWITRKYFQPAFAATRG